MEAHRINGVKTHLEALSDQELENHMGYAHQRIERAEGDLELLGIESARRFDATLPDNVVPIRTGQLALEGFNGPDEAA